MLFTLAHSDKAFEYIFTKIDAYCSLPLTSFLIEKEIILTSLILFILLAYDTHVCGTLSP